MTEDKIIDIIFDEKKFNDLYTGSERDRLFKLIKAKGVFNCYKDELLKVSDKKKHVNKLNKLGVKFYKFVYEK